MKKIKRIKKQKHIIRKRRGGSMENEVKVQWEDTPEEQEAFNRQNYDEIKRMTVTPGEHRIAIIGNPFFYKRHWITNRKRSANCPGTGCPLCSVNDLPVGRYVVNVYNYKDKVVEILEFGRGLKNDLATIIRLWGNNLDIFDIILTRVGKTKEDTKYTPVAVPRTEKLPKDLKPYELSKIYQPTPIDVIIKILEGKEEKKEETSSTGIEQKPGEEKPIETGTLIKEGDVVIEDETADIDLDKLIESDTV